MTGKRKKSTRTPARRTTASRKKPRAGSPTGPRDLRGEVRALRDTILDGLSTRPAASSRERARRGAWDKILRQRAPETRRRLEDLMKPKRWVFGEGDDDPGVALVPTHFDHAIRQVIASAYTRMGGALRQYHSVRVVWRPKLQFGIKAAGNAPLGSKSAISRQRKAAETERKKKREARTEAYEETLDFILEDFTEKRELLRGVLDGLQSVTDGLLRAEEKRLRALAQAAPAAVKTVARPLLDELRRRRIAAADFRTLSGEKSSAYGSLLRAWNTARRKAARVLA